MAVLVSASTGLPCRIVAGLGAPPLGPAMRSTWRTITDASSLKQRAYRLDSVCEGSLYLIGPLLVGVILSVASPPAALLAAASLMLVRTLGMVWMPPARQIRSPGSSAPLRFDLGPLAAPGLWLVAAILATAVGLNMAFTSIAARAQTQGLPAAAGYVEAAIALGSIAGGLLWGRRRHTRTHSTHLAGLVAVLAIGIAMRGSDKPYISGHPHGGHGPCHSPALRRLLSGRRRAGTRTPADRGKHLGQHREQHWQRRRRLRGRPTHRSCQHFGLIRRRRGDPRPYVSPDLAHASQHQRQERHLRSRMTSASVADRTAGTSGP
jgi:hypothetical protein